MTFLERLRATTKKQFERIYSHPFLLGMAHGTLPLECYKRYMLQDYLYVQQYVKLYALAAIKTTQDPELRKRFTGGIELTITSELTMHRENSIKLGLTPDQLDHTELAPTATAYMNFLTCISHTGSLAEIVAAMLPCAWTYGELAKNLLEINGAGLEHPVYGEWIRTYSDDEFIAASYWLIPLMEDLAKDLSPSELDRLEQLFLTASRYEYMFWEMGWSGNDWPLQLPA